MSPPINFFLIACAISRYDAPLSPLNSSREICGYSDGTYNPPSGARPASRTSLYDLPVFETSLVLIMFISSCGQVRAYDCYRFFAAFIVELLDGNIEVCHRSIFFEPIPQEDWETSLERLFFRLPLFLHIHTVPDHWFRLLEEFLYHRMYVVFSRFKIHDEAILSQPCHGWLFEVDDAPRRIEHKISVR